VAGAEFSRHVDRDFRPEVVGRPLARHLYALRVHLPAVLDLRQPAVHGALALADSPRCFLDKPLARAVARYVRVTTPAVAAWVPSVAFLDELSRGVLLVFLDKLPPDAAAFVLDVADAGLLRFGR
jgi:hypothetical protein